MCLLINKSIGIALIAIAIPIYLGAGKLPTKPLQLTNLNQIDSARSSIITINAQLVTIDSNLNFTITDGNTVLNISGDIQNKDILNFVTNNQKVYARFSLIKQGDSINLLSIKQIEHETYIKQIPLSDIATKTGLVGDRQVILLK